MALGLVTVVLSAAALAIVRHLLHASEEACGAHCS
jgi:hypothetical protein